MGNALSEMDNAILATAGIVPSATIGNWPSATIGNWPSATIGNGPSEFTTPWRTMSWGDKKNPLEELKNLQLGNEQVGTLKILLIGSVGAGKSSFINSINDIFQGHVTTDAIADSTGGESFTKIYRTHRIRNPSMPGSNYSFAFNDVMGQEGKNGLRTSDIINAMKGHVKEGYKFNASSSLSEDEPYYRPNPSLEDQVHCLVTVVAADTIGIMDPELITKLKEIRQAASDLRIPQMVVLTKVDLACKDVKGNLQSVYKSIYLKEKMEQVSAKTGVPMNCILPVKNYHEEIDLQVDMDVLLLKALFQMVNFANDHVKNLPVS